MKKKTIQQVFISFLKVEGVFEKYCKNWDRRFTYQRPIKNREHYIALAFHWNKTPEIYIFWYNLDVRWRRHLQNFKETNPGYYHTRCNDCGQFIKRDLWIKKDSSDKFHAHCSECLSYYD